MKKLTEKQQELVSENKGLAHAFLHTKVSSAKRSLLGEEELLDAFTDVLINCAAGYNSKYLSSDSSVKVKEACGYVNFSSYVYKSFGNRVSTMTKQVKQKRLCDTDIVKPRRRESDLALLGANESKVEVKPLIDEKRLLECIDSVGLSAIDKRILLSRYLDYGGKASSEIVKDLKMTRQNIYKRSNMAAKKVNDYMKANGIHYDDFIIK